MHTDSLAGRALSRGFLLSWLAGAVVALQAWHYDAQALLLKFLLPFYLMSLALQYVLPKTRAPLERGELATDIISNSVVLAVNQGQNALVAGAFALASSSLLVRAGWLDPHATLAGLPFWPQVILSILVYDLLFYWAHRLAHTVPALWRFHAVHHCAHRVTFLNAYRVHPVDVLWRRFVPLLGLLLCGPSHDAFVAATVIGTVLATVTHLNIDLRHGWLNYLVGTNEIHRWHHSTVHDEAKNFGAITLWDQLFGTFHYPRDRDMPARLGLADERNFPLHDYWRQLWWPFRRR